MVLVLGLLAIGILARFLPHVPNFSPVMAIALFGGVYLSRSQAWWLPLLLMIVTDLVLGLHTTVPFTWGAVLLISILGIQFRKKVTPLNVVALSLVSACIFFVITNFGAWLAFYPLTREGLMFCYTQAIPFFRTTLVSTLAYSVVLFGMYELIARRVNGTRLAIVLLNK